MYSFAVLTISRNRSRGTFDCHLDARAGPGLRMREIPPQLALEEIDLGAGELVERLEIVIGRDPRVRDDQDPMLHVIERQHGVEDHESGFVLQRGIRLAIVSAASPARTMRPCRS